MRSDPGFPQSSDVGSEPVAEAAAGVPTTAEFAAIYQREFGYVWHTLRRLGVPRRDLSDVTHNVFLVVHNRFASYDRERPIRPWIFGVAFRVAADYMRLARHRSELVRDDVDAWDGHRGADDLIGEKEDQAVLREALACLDMERRAVVVLHDLDGVGGPEIAEVLQIPPKTVYYRLRTGREQLVAAVRRIRAQRGRR